MAKAAREATSKPAGRKAPRRNASPKTETIAAPKGKAGKASKGKDSKDGKGSKGRRKP